MFPKSSCSMLRVAAILVLISFSFAQKSSFLPEFRSPECDQFRQLLRRHSDVSRFDRKHSTNLGIAGVVLFWTGIPGIPLGIAAILTGKRIDTKARRSLEMMNVSEDNYRRVNELCGVLLDRDPLSDVTFRGQNVDAVVLGAVALGLSLLVLIIQLGYGAILVCHKETKSYEMECIREEETIC